MTGTAASSTGRRAAQRIKTLTDIAALAEGLSHGNLAGDLPAALSERLTPSRFRTRLERRFLRRTGAADAPADLLEGPASRLVFLGDKGLRDVIVDTGILCQYAILRRIVDQSMLAELSADLGVALSMHDARRATHGESIDKARAIAAPNPAIGEGVEAITTAILRDGLQCWTCWVHGQPPSMIRFLGALTPTAPHGGSGRNGTDVATGIATEGCRPRDCRFRSDLFSVRLDIALQDREEPARKEA